MFLITSSETFIWYIGTLPRRSDGTEVPMNTTEQAQDSLAGVDLGLAKEATGRHLNYHPCRL
jgi:hypothetical protein